MEQKNFILLTEKESRLYIGKLLSGKAKGIFADELKDLQKRHVSHGWTNVRGVNTWLEYERDYPPGYLQAHPERKEEYYKYGDLEGVKKVWTMRAYSNYETEKQEPGRKIVV